MEANGKIAIIGDRDSVTAFKVLGISVYDAETPEKAEQLLKKLAREYSVIYITEDLAQKCKGVIDRYKARPFPAVIPLPSASGATGFGIAQVYADVEKAVGSNILNNN
ncbi:MAG: V-type ATP synthase subunit F [Christensenellaceae bacterium]|jgi:V/A-type H+-transporting ATPase subunit F|nr:V-type ATP synthase subunit F [Christensenellaceae bacterium]